MAKTNHLGALPSGLLLAALMVACLLLTAEPAHAATFTVNSTADREDENAGDGSCFTGPPGRSGDGVHAEGGHPGSQSLRADTINIAIPGNGPHTMHAAKNGCPVRLDGPPYSRHTSQANR